MPEYALALASIATVLVWAAMVVQKLLSRLATSILTYRLAANWWLLPVPGRVHPSDGLRYDARD